MSIDPERGQRRDCSPEVWKAIRIALLLVALGVVATQAWLDRRSTRDWTETLWVGIYPLNGDGSDAADSYIASLDGKRFAGIEDFFAREAPRYSIAIDRPVRVELYPRLARLPPRLAPDAGVLTTMAWSLRLRWYALRAPEPAGLAPPDIRVFVLYHDPDRSGAVPHSLGLQKGLLGVVYAFAERSMDGANAVVIAHETLHTLGATDKYELDTLQPLVPDGLAEPDRTPQFPQDSAEIMAGRRAISAGESVMPDSLRDVVIGAATAREIAWGLE